MYRYWNGDCLSRCEREAAPLTEGSADLLDGEQGLIAGPGDKFAHSLGQAARIEPLAETVPLEFSFTEKIFHRYPPVNGLGG